MRPLTSLALRVAQSHGDSLMANRLASRVTLADSVGDPKELVHEFKRAVESLEIPPEKLKWAKEVAQERAKHPIVPNPSDWMKALDIAQEAARNVIRGGYLLSMPGHKLFLSILQSYVLPPALRKKVEIASRDYLKSTKKKRYMKDVETEVTAYEKFITKAKSHLGFALEAVAKGKAHSEEGAGATKMKVGPFTLVNTGGFSEKQMNEVADVVHKATAYLQTSGFSEVCYGEVQVTNTIHKSNVLAFYLVAKDELFIRANVKESSDVVRTVLHELGHRFEHKFLTSKKRDIQTLYQMLGRQEIDRKYKKRDKLKEKLPAPGEKLTAKGKTYVVVKTLPDYKLGYKVYLQEDGKSPRDGASIGIEGWLSLTGGPHGARDFDADPQYIGYVSEYAKTGGPGENFAEMFAYYCMGRLPVLQSVPFEELVFGTGKTAASRIARLFQVQRLNDV